MFNRLTLMKTASPKGMMTIPLTLSAPACAKYLATNFITGDYYEAEFLEKITKYDKEYFENNFLVLVRLEAISGSIKFKFAGLDDTGKMHVQEIWPAYEMTDDMAYWHIIIEVPHSHPAIPADVDFIIELTRISEE